ncbi:Hypothetical protein A7982_10789 [Minicystis rosea]|nr:Hypothetical protein A7982_10789 [Minicystis rosea]
MKKWTALFAFLLIPAACTVSVAPSDGVILDDGSCDAVSCGDALFGGLSAAGQPICDSVSDSRYGDVFACACGGGCADVCFDNLCDDLGETSACGDCLDQLCGVEHDICAND